MKNKAGTDWAERERERVGVGAGASAAGRQTPAPTEAPLQVADFVMLCERFHGNFTGL